MNINLLVAPIFSGSGTRLKILESLSFGRPVVTTEIGAEGIEITSRLLTIIPKQTQNQPETWAQKIININNEKFPKNEFDNLRDQLKNLTWNRIFSREQIFLGYNDSIHDKDLV